jgi:hypothetical protein
MYSTVTRLERDIRLLKIALALLAAAVVILLIVK